MQVVIMGCGRVGSSLALAMNNAGHEVSVVDKDPSAFRRLGDSFTGRRVKGVGFDREVLRAAGIETADAFAAVSSGDNSNIISARVARELFDVERVVARIYDARRAAVYERLGIPTVATVPWTTERFVSALGERGENAAGWVDPTGEVTVTLLPYDESWVGTPLARFQQATGGRVAFLKRQGRSILPESKSVLQHGDTIYVAALRTELDTVAQAIAGRRPDDVD
ncbi:TrkA family potassium uptake protein [Gordonia jinhuaensis]|uniref:Trk system potassium uptake protein TrkA n=1 Tax=Gordonia jinhuaensis TaxID=1517702 RepID=A0A916T270_9ACTN|nr:TrkA family potassium uptake protein [Gordonia jinhuaensis]GGB25655.1 potassium transporter TrkA [Gordonia jinhuaensis]